MANEGKEVFGPMTKPLNDDGILHFECGREYAKRKVRVTVEIMSEEPQHKGSRQHLLKLLGNNFTTQMSDIIDRKDVVLSDDPHPVPASRTQDAETDLDTYIALHCREVWPQASELDGGRWWAPHGGTRPQMDLICSIQFGGGKGLLFVEAKAHEGELDWGGKPLADDASVGSRNNHENIINEIEAANKALNGLCAGFNLSITSHYQLVNRLTYLWKLSSLHIPVVLMYLGFLGDSETFPKDHLKGDAHWQRVMGGYMQGIVPQKFADRVWDDPNIGAPMLMLVRSQSVAEPGN